ncbi:uncharacterized protein [Argopecten irradians]|uniref:uncharacterized protein n=1 Tax=Argopecten irradians TaxID=31199 RepID=UPI00371CB82C
MKGIERNTQNVHLSRLLRITVLALCFGMLFTIWRMDFTSKMDPVIIPPKVITLQRKEPQQRSIQPIIPILSQTVSRTKGYLVYDCSYKWPGSCGGWSDRISGILSTSILAILSNRKFLINFDNPCPLENFFEPKSYDWRYNSKLLKNKTSHRYHLKDYSGKKIMKVLTTANSTKQIKDFFNLTSEVIFVRINWDMTPEFRKFLHVEKYVPWITQLHYADIYRYIFDLFFQPKPYLIIAINNVLKNKQTKTSFCAHVRIGRSSTLPKDNVRTKAENVHVILDFIKSIDKSKHDLFLATDSDDLQRQFMANYSKNFILKVPGRITHIDQTRTGNICDGFQKQLLDFLLLTRCDKLVVCESGFSMMAAYWRANSNGLYCWTHKGVVPCSRYTVNDFFPRPLIGPPR